MLDLCKLDTSPREAASSSHVLRAPQLRTSTFHFTQKGRVDQSRRARCQGLILRLESVVPYLIACGLADKVRSVRFTVVLKAIAHSISDQINPLP